VPYDKSKKQNKYFHFNGKTTLSNRKWQYEVNIKCVDLILTCFFLILLVAILDMELALKRLLPLAEVSVLAGPKTWENAAIKCLKRASSPTRRSRYEPR
jgi:hypothetical protein